jgi:hypothetical protein
MKPTSNRAMHKALASRLAARDIPDDVLKSLADRLTIDDLTVGGIDFCPYGICIDYFSEKPVEVATFAPLGKYRELRLFPWGILDDELWRVRLEVQVPELQNVRVR